MQLWKAETTRYRMISCKWVHHFLELGTQTLNRTQQQTEVKQPIEGFQETNLKKRRPQIHLVRQNPWLQRDRIYMQMISAF